MFNNLGARIALIAALALGSVWLLYDNFQERDTILTLGLDLRGGTQLSLEVDDPSAALGPEQRQQTIERALKIIRTRIDELGVAEPVVQRVGDERIVVELPGARPEDQRRAREMIQRSAFLEFKIVATEPDMSRPLAEMDRAVAARFGATAAAGGQAPTGALGGIFDTPADSAAAAAGETPAAKPFSSKLQPAGPGQFAVPATDVAEVERYLALPEVQRALPRGTHFAWGFQGSAEQAAPYRTLYLLEQRAIMTGEELEDAQAQRDPQLGQPEVTFELSRRGGREFRQATGQHVGDFLAVVLDGKVYSAPTIQSEIGSSGRITLGGASMEEARDLALVLRAGALPAPVKIVEERTVGPTLGADSIEKGRVAGIIGISIVILIMVLYYKVSGVLAVVALSLYMLFLLGGLASVGAALTLPGIAGIVLSIGMAVDANVLIFERIREELSAGRAPRLAVSEGFRHALSAIVDSNITTLLTAAILFYIGTGPVRGFAVTLAIGIVASMFTAIFVTRTLFMLYVDRGTTRTAVSI